MKKIVIIIFLFTSLTALQAAETQSNRLASKKIRHALGRLSLSLESGLDQLQQTSPVRIVFSEFPEPPTPSAQEVELFGLPLTLICTPDHKASIIIKPKGGAYTPSKVTFDFGDKSGDQTFDLLKLNLPKNPETQAILLTAVLAKQVRNYMESLKPGGAATAVDVKTIKALAEQHGQSRIVKILSNIEKHRKYDEQIYHDYDVHLCKLQKPAEVLLRDAGLVLLKSKSQDLSCT